jgi:hypothetical protein
MLKRLAAKHQRHLLSSESTKLNARAHDPNAPIRSEAKVMVDGERKAQYSSAAQALFELVITCDSHATNAYQSGMQHICAPELTTLHISI